MVPKICTKLFRVSNSTVMLGKVSVFLRMETDTVSHFLDVFFCVWWMVDGNLNYLMICGLFVEMMGIKFSMNFRFYCRSIGCRNFHLICFAGKLLTVTFRKSLIHQKYFCIYLGLNWECWDCFDTENTEIEWKLDWWKFYGN
jgi:hypothetical protein